MTLIVGIRCSDGVVIGSDSAVTFASGQQLTISQRSDEKISVIHDKAIVAGTGQVGLGQRFQSIVEREVSTHEFFKLSLIEKGKRLASATISDFTSTGVQSLEFGALVAVLDQTSAELIEFPANSMQPEIKSRDCWYVSMGSGQFVADPLLGFFRATFWKDGPPNWEDGVFAAVMVLDLACEMVPLGVSGPIQLAFLRCGQDMNEPAARKASQEELSEHLDNVKSAREHFRQYRTRVVREHPPDIPSLTI